MLRIGEGFCLLRKNHTSGVFSLRNFSSTKRYRKVYYDTAFYPQVFRDLLFYLPKAMSRKWLTSPYEDLLIRQVSEVTKTPEYGYRNR